jgi:hypothetical protein
MYFTEWSSCYPMVLAVVLLFMESTAIFTTPRWMFKQHGLKEGNIFMSIDSVFIFLSFIGCRILFQTVLIIWSMLPYYYWALFKTDTMTVGYLISCPIMFATVLVNYGLNCYWMHLINKQVYRLIKGTAK